jgi:hypothetical protein
MPAASGRIPALAFLKLHGCDLLYFLVFLQTRETRRARPHTRPRNEKPGAACRPGSWRSFGEYAFLEDSRYTSQAKNWLAGRHLKLKLVRRIKAGHLPLATAAWLAKAPKKRKNSCRFGVHSENLGYVYFLYQNCCPRRRRVCFVSF